MDSLRRVIRSRIGYRSPLYRWLSSACNFLAISVQEGLAMAFRLSRFANEAPGRKVELRFRGLAHPIAIRPGTPDVQAVINNVVREEYGAILPREAPAFIIDAGGYIGDSAAYFASKYPQAQIVTLEPHPDNYALAKANVAAYGDRVQLLNAALASAPGMVSISGEYDGAVVGEAGATVEAINIPQLMQMAGRDWIDLLKMDIEGAEIDALGPTADAWLCKVGLVVIELHGPDATAVVLETMRRNDFSATPYRSLWYCRPNVMHG